MILGLIFAPLVLAMFLFLIPENQKSWISRVNIAGSIFLLLITIFAICQFEPTHGQFGFVTQAAWIPQFGIEFLIGVDRMSLTLIALTALIHACGFLYLSEETKNYRLFSSLLFLLEGSVIGIFCSLDLFLLFLFWEVGLLPMYFLIGFWGGEHRIYAATKYFLFSLFGSFLILVGIVGIYALSEPQTFSLLQLLNEPTSLSGRIFEIGDYLFEADKWLWVFLTVGFLIKIPSVPFHSWLPWAHVQAPTVISVILAGVLLKLGGYGFLRINLPVFPEASQWGQIVLVGLGVLSALYASFCAFAQKDLKKLIAYSSIAHMGFCLVGFGSGSALGTEGAYFQMISHGVISAGLFFLVGILENRAGHRWLETPEGERGFSGLFQSMPRLTFVASILIFAAMGVPTMSGFVGEFFVLLGTFEISQFQWAVYGLIVSLIVGAAYFLWAYQKIFFGEMTEVSSRFADLSAKHTLVMWLLVIVIFALGLYPAWLIEWVRPDLLSVVK